MFRCAAPAVTALLMAALVGCPEKPAPSDAAIGGYLARQDGYVAAAAGADAAALPAPVARRVQLTVVSGRDLPDNDTGPGVTDPYVIVEYEGQRWESSVVEGSQEPAWGDSFVFDVRPGGALTLTLMDEDAFPSSDEKMGVVSQPLPIVRVGGTETVEISFRDGEMGVITLRVHGLARQ